MRGMGRDLPDLTLLRRACAPCGLRNFCQQSGLPFPAEGRADEQMRRLPRGGSLFRTGDQGNNLYVVRTGALKTVAVTPDGSEHVLGFHLPGELVGLDALSDGRHGAEAIALADSQVCALPVQQLLDRGAHAPEMGRELLRVIGGSTSHCQVHVEVLMRRQAGERIALFLQDLLERVAAARGPQRELHLPMSREEIGHYLGLALETVSRGFSRLQDDGVIRVAGRQVEILDEPRLRLLAQNPGPDSDPSLKRRA